MSARMCLNFGFKIYSVELNILNINKKNMKKQQKIDSIRGKKKKKENAKIRQLKFLLVAVMVGIE